MYYFCNSLILSAFVSPYLADRRNQTLSADNTESLWIFKGLNILIE